LAEQEMADARARLLETNARVSRIGSRGSSDASSKASGVSNSHRSRGRARTAESDKARSLGGQFEEMLSSAHENSVTVHSIVSSPKELRSETGPAGTSRSASGSGCATSTETIQHNPLS
jgi:hypothetical protein